MLVQQVMAALLLQKKEVAATKELLTIAFYLCGDNEQFF
ncbi:hypothetical protein EV06_0234 [Prochlorococcus sp. MIT 0602]|nr:hypothetical protein EV06_0234 [Prochlorococcus sp. MIT 0602]KGG17128.1 hypothetical protein EV07_0561 [Prochlorococcus sp. MIT 0603]